MKTLNHCRLCNSSDVPDVLDLGRQALQGQFPASRETALAMPRHPLVVCRCRACGLAQLRHTLPAAELYREYWYRSGVTATMRAHLAEVATEALRLLGHEPGWIMDIGCNDGTLIRHLPRSAELVGLDPSDAAEEAAPYCMLVRDYFPTSDRMVNEQQFDLVFSLACFYDADDPLAFARAVRDYLAPAGLWCVEVADLQGMLLQGAFDAICFEHLTYWSEATLVRVAVEAGLRLVSMQKTACNGGSILAFFCRAECESYPIIVRDFLNEDGDEWGDLLLRIASRCVQTTQRLRECREQGKRIHILGASTKGNTLLQRFGIGPTIAEYASDRDPRKAGRFTPGTGIEIVSEEASRAMRPDVYFVLPWHFRTEIIAREANYLAQGGQLLFPIEESL